MIILWLILGGTTKLFDINVFDFMLALCLAHTSWGLVELGSSDDTNCPDSHFPGARLSSDVTPDPYSQSRILGWEAGLLFA